MSFLFSPLKQLLNHRIEKRNDIRGKRSRATTPPHAIPGRKSKIAASLAAPGSKTHPQPKSPLFARLPPELRRLIFAYALGGATFHLSVRGRDLRTCSWTCGSPAACRALRTVDCARPWSVKLEGENGQSRRGLLALPLTCRAAFFEALHLLYEENAFVTSHPDYVEFLPRVLTPSALASVRTFSFSLEFKGPPQIDVDAPHDYKTVLWRNVWANVAQMTGLETLCVSVVVAPTAAWLWVQHEDEILEPLRAVTAPSSFDLYLPYTDAPCEVRDLPCRVHRVSPAAE